MNFDRCYPMSKNALISNLKSVWPKTFKNNELFDDLFFIIYERPRFRAAYPRHEIVASYLIMKEP